MKFKLGDIVRKTKGSEWQGKVVGTYSTKLTPEGYCVESDVHKGSVQIYPASALEIAKSWTKYMEVKREDEPYGRNGGVVCDTNKGPCACGAWH